MTDIHPSLSLFLLGAPRLERHTRTVPVGRRKVMALLAYLALTNRVHSREALAALLWPDNSPAQAYGSLRRCLSLAREIVGAASLDITRQTVRFKWETAVWLDASEFHRCLSAAQIHQHSPGDLCPDCLENLSRAVALYRGDFLAGFTLPDAPDFDEWQFWQRETLQRDCAWILEQLAAYYAEQAQLETAITYARRWVHLDPLHEPAQQQLIRFYLMSGQPAAAQRQYQCFTQRLAEELGTAPTAETTALVERLRLETNQITTPSPEQVKGSLAIASPPGNLPALASPFVGREWECQQVDSWLRESTCRLITLTGLGGTGKTRLALQAAGGCAAQFTDGVYFVPLETAVSLPDLLNTLGNTLPFSPGAGMTPEQLLHYLRPKQALLVLDNFEQLTAAAGFLSRLLAAAPHLKLLVTSRYRLNLQEEWHFPLGGLAYPAEDSPEMTSPEVAFSEVVAYTAVQLFVQCARRQHPGFALSPATLPHAVRICQQLGGLPLGIELAAGWTPLLSCQEIAAEMARGLAFPAATGANVPERHHSLQVVCQQTWQMLPPAEQEALQQLTVFCGTFDRQAATAVTGAPLSLLRRLLDRSLLHSHRPGHDGEQDEQAGGRLYLHPVIRHFASSQTGQTAAQEAALKRHGRYYLHFLQQQETPLQDHRQAAALAAIGTDLDNSRAAWHWAMAESDAPALEQALAALHLFYAIRGFFWQGIADFTPENIGGGGAAPGETFFPRLAGRLLVRQGCLYLRLSRLAEAEERLQQGQRLLSPVDETTTYDVALAEQGMGDLCLARGQLDGAWGHYQACLATFRRLGRLFDAARILASLGNVACQLEDLAQAEQWDEEALRLFQEIDNPLGMAICLNNLSYHAESVGDVGRAERLLQESGQLAVALNSYWLTAVILANLGGLAQQQGQEANAAHFFQESLSLRQQHQLPGAAEVEQALDSCQGFRHHHFAGL